MDYLKCEVRLGGNVQNTVMRRDVTPAEIEVLRAKHGADAIVNIEVTRSDDSNANNVSSVALRESLVGKYGKIVYELFPGARPNVPVTAEEIGVVEVKAKPKAKPKAEPAPEPEPEPTPEPEVKAKPAAPAPKKAAAVPQTTVLLDD